MLDRDEIAKFVAQGIVANPATTHHIFAGRGEYGGPKAFPTTQADAELIAKRAYQIADALITQSKSK